MASESPVPDCCAKTPRIVPRDYTRKGADKVTSGGLRFYEVAEDVKRDDVVVLYFHDMVGNNNSQSDQQADRINTGLGVRVVAPYWYGEADGYPGKLGPGMDWDHIHKWSAENASEEQLDARKEEILKHIYSEGVSKIAAIGFCFGGYQICRWTADTRISVAASVHGRVFTAENGSKVRIPFLNIASQNEAQDQTPFKEAMPKDVQEKYEFHLFDDVPHGFAAARGDWTDNETHRKRAEEAIHLFVDFVKKNGVV